MISVDEIKIAAEYALEKLYRDARLETRIELRVES